MIRLLWQPLRRLGYDLKATGHGVEGARVGRKARIIVAFDKSSDQVDVVADIGERVFGSIRKHKLHRRQRGAAQRV
jgi:hypothetical protein